MVRPALIPWVKFALFGLLVSLLSTGRMLAQAPVVQNQLHHDVSRPLRELAVNPPAMPSGIREGGRTGDVYFHFLLQRGGPPSPRLMQNKSLSWATLDVWSTSIQQLCFPWPRFYESHCLLQQHCCNLVFILQPCQSGIREGGRTGDDCVDTGFQEHRRRPRA